MAIVVLIGESIFDFLAGRHKTYSLSATSSWDKPAYACVQYTIVISTGLTGYTVISHAFCDS